MTLFLQFAKRLTIISAAIAVFVLLLSFIPGFPREIAEYALLSVLFYYLLTGMSYLIASGGVKDKRTGKFLLFTTTAFLVKFIVCIGAFVFFYYVLHVEATLFTIPYLAFYIFYNIFETIHLLKFNKLIYMNRKTEMTTQAH